MIVANFKRFRWHVGDTKPYLGVFYVHLCTMLPDPGRSSHLALVNVIASCLNHHRVHFGRYSQEYEQFPKWLSHEMVHSTNPGTNGGFVLISRHEPFHACGFRM